MTGLVVFWLLCGVVSAIIAGSRNRNPVGWFVVGCLIGVFGIVLLLALPQAQPGRWHGQALALPPVEQAPVYRASKAFAVVATVTVYGLAGMALVRVLAG